MKTKNLNLNEPADAREFLTKVMKKCLPGRLDYVVLASGRKLKVKDMTDSEAVQYAIELLPIYQKKFPHLVEIKQESSLH